MYLNKSPFAREKKRLCRLVRQARRAHAKKLLFWLRSSLERLEKTQFEERGSTHD
jgi:hypothetical protein